MTTWVPDIAVSLERWISRAEVCGLLIIGLGIVALLLGRHYHLCASGLCRGVMHWPMTLSIFVVMLVIYALLARETFFPFCREVRDYLLARAGRERR
jgi:ABC-type sugar transport system permease subunit